jgi:hypothetical protein
MGRDFATEVSTTAEAPASPLSVVHLPLAEAKTAFQSMDNGCGNAAARAILPQCHFGGGESGQPAKLALSPGEKTPIEENGWSKTGGGHYVKDFPLPEDWGSMSREDQNKWLQGVMDQSELDSKGFKGNEMPMGRSIDPLTGEHIWIGWAGDAPSKEDQKWLGQGSKSGL